MKLVVEAATILNIAFGSLALALLALFLKGLHSAYLYDKNMRMLDRDHQEYLKTAPIEGVNIFRAEQGEVLYPISDWYAYLDRTKKIEGG